MTRRAQAEAMITRYGEPVACGGETYRAFLRPVTSGDRLRFFYLGPAVHKLTAQSVLTAADGREYAVLQSKTVCLGGEELYVRARLAPKGPEIRLERDGKLLAHASDFSAEAAGDTETVIPWGESEPAAVAEGAMRWKVALTGLLPESGAELFGPGEYRILILFKGKTEAYTGCRWKSIRGTGVESTCTAEFLALKREVTENG